jgi:hypothetical protein
MHPSQTYGLVLEACQSLKDKCYPHQLIEMPRNGVSEAAVLELVSGFNVAVGFSAMTICISGFDRKWSALERTLAIMLATHYQPGKQADRREFLDRFKEAMEVPSIDATLFKDLSSLLKTFGLGDNNEVILGVEPR